MNKQIRNLSILSVATVLATCSINAVADDHPGHHGGYHNGGNNRGHESRAITRGPGPRLHVEIDARHGHNRYYPRPGVGFRSLPGGYYTTHFHGSPYYFREGIWYRHGGAGYVVVRPPVGAFIGFLPPFYTTVWFGGSPYYYADNIYYRWDVEQRGYIVSDPPGSADNTPPATVQEEVFVYPKNGQNAEQQATDRYDCYRWAADQTSFDPTKTSGGVDAADQSSKRDDYRRAEAACLDARGYSVK